MSSLLLSTIEDAQEYGYESLPDADDLYHSLRWLKMDEGVGIARPFSVLSVPGAGRSPAAAAGWGLVVDEAAFWPFMRIDFVLSRLLEDRQVPRTPGIDKMLDSLMPSAYLGALRGGTTRLAGRVQGSRRRLPSPGSARGGSASVVIGHSPFAPESYSQVRPPGRLIREDRPPGLLIWRVPSRLFDPI